MTWSKLKSAAEVKSILAPNNEQAKYMVSDLYFNKIDLILFSRFGNLSNRMQAMIQFPWLAYIIWTR